MPALKMKNFRLGRLERQALYAALAQVYNAKEQALGAVMREQQILYYWLLFVMGFVKAESGINPSLKKHFELCKEEDEELERRDVEQIRQRSKPTSEGNKVANTDNSSGTSVLGSVVPQLKPSPLFSSDWLQKYGLTMQHGQQLDGHFSMFIDRMILMQLVAHHSQLFAEDQGFIDDVKPEFDFQASSVLFFTELHALLARMVPSRSAQELQDAYDDLATKMSHELKRIQEGFDDHLRQLPEQDRPVLAREFVTKLTEQDRFRLTPEGLPISNVSPYNTVARPTPEQSNQTPTPSPAPTQPQPKAKVKQDQDQGSQGRLSRKNSQADQQVNQQTTTSTQTLLQTVLRPVTTTQGG